MHRKAQPTIAVIDSKSIPSGYAPSEKGVDGHKKIKGIKRQLAVDSLGLPLCVDVTRGNVHDSKGVSKLLADLKLMYSSVAIIKADKGYRVAKAPNDITLSCVKTNFGSSEFRPIDGRWVVERTFAWLGAFRRINCNYERYLTTALAMTNLACIFFILRL